MARYRSLLLSRLAQMNIRFRDVYIPACALRLDHGDAMQLKPSQAAFDPTSAN